MNLKQLNTIGSGAYFPIQLEEVKDENKTTFKEIFYKKISSLTLNS